MKKYIRPQVVCISGLVMFAIAVGNYFLMSRYDDFSTENWKVVILWGLLGTGCLLASGVDALLITCANGFSYAFHLFQGGQGTLPPANEKRPSPPPAPPGYAGGVGDVLARVRALKAQAADYRQKAAQCDAEADVARAQAQKELQELKELLGGVN